MKYKNMDDFFEQLSKHQFWAIRKKDSKENSFLLDNTTKKIHQPLKSIDSIFQKNDHLIASNKKTLSAKNKED